MSVFGAYRDGLDCFGASEVRFGAESPAYVQAVEAAGAWQPHTHEEVRRVLQATVRLLDACKLVVQRVGGAGISFLISTPSAESLDQRRVRVLGVLAANAELERKKGAVPSDAARGELIDATQLCVQVLKSVDDESAKQALAALVDLITAIPRKILEPISTATKWLIGGAVVVAAIGGFVVYKVASGPTGRYAARRYIGGR